MRVPAFAPGFPGCSTTRSEEHTSELQSQSNLVCRLLLEKKKEKIISNLSSEYQKNMYIQYFGTPVTHSFPSTAHFFYLLHTIFFDLSLFFFFFFNDPATTEIYTLSLHDALPICNLVKAEVPLVVHDIDPAKTARRSEEHTSELQSQSNLVCRLLLEKKKKKT